MNCWNLYRTTMLWQEAKLKKWLSISQHSVLCLSLMLTYTKPRKSRSQRREEKFKDTIVKPAAEVTPEVPLEFQIPTIPTNIIQMQQNHPTFKWKWEKGNLRLSLTVPKSHQHGPAKQLVIPQAVQDVVLTLGCFVPWTGDLGKHKSTACIKRHFYWPGLHSDVAQFCRSFPQKTSIQGSFSPPLQPLPVISIPFEFLGTEIVCLLE